MTDADSPQANAVDVAEISRRLEAFVRDEPEAHALFSKAIHSDPAKTVTKAEFARLEALNHQANEFYDKAPQDIRQLLAAHATLRARLAECEAALVASKKRKVYVAEQNNYTYGQIIGVFQSFESAASVFGLKPSDFQYHELGKSHFYVRPDRSGDQEYGNATIYELEFGNVLFPAESFVRQPAEAAADTDAGGG